MQRKNSQRKEKPPRKSKPAGAGKIAGTGKIKGKIQVITRATAILRALEDQPLGLSLGEIASRVGLARSTVQRIVAALAAEKFLIAASPTGRVRLGPTITRLATSVSTDFVAIARPHLVRLSEELEETVDLAVIKGDHLLFIDQAVGPQRLRAVSAVGESFPLYCTANGKAYLAQLGERAVEQLVGRKFEKRTPRTAATLAELQKELKAVRSAGVAYDLEEHTPGICAVGVALRDPFGNHVAISVPVPAQRFKLRKDAIAKLLLRTKLGALIDDLLAFSRLGRQSMQIVDLDMTQLARTTYEELLTQQPHNSVEFHLGALPRVRGDRVLLGQVWVNLLANALKFSSKEKQPHIEVSAISDKKEHVYFVRDNGVGFDPRYQAKLYGVFQRLHDASEFPGTGVGLALVQRIVTRHGGRVWADSKLNEGATFYFTLPKEQVDGTV